MNVWAVVPVKPLNRAKSRLAAALSAEMREQLAVKMLHHTVKCLVDCSAVSGILVISRDTRALVIAREYGAKTVQESGAPELNPALERASQVIETASHRGISMCYCRHKMKHMDRACSAPMEQPSFQASTPSRIASRNSTGVVFSIHHTMGSTGSEP